MSDENVSGSKVTPPTNDKTSNYEDSEGLSIKAGDSLKPAEDTTPPSEDREQVNQVEDTTVKNETESKETNTTAEKAVSEESKDEVDRSGKVIRELGEGRKALAEGLLELARNDEVAKTKLVKLVNEFPSLQKHFKSKFGEEYETVLKQEVSEKKEIPAINEEQIRKEERIRAKAEILEEQLNASKQKELEHFALSIGFSADEAEELKETASVLEGTKSKDKVIDWTDALKKAAMTINYDKASKKVQIPRGTGLSKNPQPNKAEMTPEVEQYALRTGRNPKDILSGLERVEKQITNDGHTMRLSLD
jgi:hypothetical protein